MKCEGRSAEWRGRGSPGAARGLGLREIRAYGNPGVCGNLGTTSLPSVRRQTTVGCSYFYSWWLVPYPTEGTSGPLAPQESHKMKNKQINKQNTQMCP